MSSTLLASLTLAIYSASLAAHSQAPLPATAPSLSFVSFEFGVSLSREWRPEVVTGSLREFFGEFLRVSGPGPCNGGVPTVVSRPILYLYRVVATD